MQDSILNVREQKRLLIEESIDKYQIVTLRANIPGPIKQTKEAYFLVNYFAKKIEKINYLFKETCDDLDGPIIFYFFSNDDECMKERMVELEEEDPLGRFVDIDVFYKSTKSLSRDTLRKCYLCDRAAFVCGRNRTHTLNELLDFILKNVFKEIDKTVTKLSNDAMMDELNLDPKFGLVTPQTNGSHEDMNYELMVKAKDAILPYMFEFFMIGYSTDDLKVTFNELRKKGLEAEKAMLKATNGINCYKGLIFCLGIVIGAIGYKNSRFTHKTIYELIEIMTKGITNELKEGRDTFGKIAYQDYGIRGARGEVEDGLPCVQMILQKYKVINKTNRLDVLMDLINNSNDTIFLKRAGSIKKYLEIKEMFKDHFRAEKLNNYCITHHLSFGGSADLLVVSIFIANIKKILYI